MPKRRSRQSSRRAQAARWPAAAPRARTPRGGRGTPRRSRAALASAAPRTPSAGAPRWPSMRSQLPSDVRGASPRRSRASGAGCCRARRSSSRAPRCPTTAPAERSRMREVVLHERRARRRRRRAARAPRGRAGRARPRAPAVAAATASPYQAYRRAPPRSPIPKSWDEKDETTKTIPIGRMKSVKAFGRARGGGGERGRAEVRDHHRVGDPDHDLRGARDDDWPGEREERRGDAAPRAAARRPAPCAL